MKTRQQARSHLLISPAHIAGGRLKDQVYPLTVPDFLLRVIVYLFYHFVFIEKQAGPSFKYSKLSRHLWKILDAPSSFFCTGT